MGITTKLANTDHLPAPENSVVSHEVREHEADNRLSPPQVFTEKKHSADDKIQSEGSSKRL